MFLSEKDFTQVIQQTPLISIDLIIRNEKSEVLLGLRTNRPALNDWFVPGGRVYKDESLPLAFERLTTDEIGLALTLDKADFLGVYEHFYADCVFSADISTHYVVLAYSVLVNKNDLHLPKEQHCDYQWISETDLVAADFVHQNTKDYFLGLGDFSQRQEHR